MTLIFKTLDTHHHTTAAAGAYLSTAPYFKKSPEELGQISREQVTPLRAGGEKEVHHRHEQAEARRLQQTSPRHLDRHRPRPSRPYHPVHARLRRTRWIPNARARHLTDRIARLLRPGVPWGRRPGSDYGWGLRQLRFQGRCVVVLVVSCGLAVLIVSSHGRKLEPWADLQRRWSWTAVSDDGLRLVDHGDQ